MRRAAITPLVGDIRESSQSCMRGLHAGHPSTNRIAPLDVIRRCATSHDVVVDLHLGTVLTQEQIIRRVGMLWNVSITERQRGEVQTVKPRAQRFVVCHQALRSAILDGSHS